MICPAFILGVFCRRYKASLFHSTRHFTAMQYKSSPILIVIFFFCILLACKNRGKDDFVADLILYNAHVYPVHEPVLPGGAVVVRNGKIIQTGKTEEILKLWTADTMIDAKGNFLMPGFIEGHGHYSSMGYNLIHIDLLNTTSWEEIIDSVAARVSNARPGEWIIGRGWHQEKWTKQPDQHVNGYPMHDALSEISPNNPVMLGHASGHGVFANAAAMSIAGISRETPDPKGGHIVRDGQGAAIGVFEEKAMDIIREAYKDYQDKQPPAERTNEWYRAIRLAENECLKHGITSFQDAGSSFEEIARYREMAENDSLNLRLWVMLRHPYEELKGHMSGFPIVRAGNDMMSCRAIKSEVDGALGSFGAWLLEPYADKPGFVGQNTTSIDDVRGIAAIAIEKDMQLCVHAIGDRANQEVLDIFENVISSHPEKKDIRWRIEHAQHLHPDDIPRFKSLGIIASMQGIHCTSDAPFVVKRLGTERARTGAYAWRSLLDQGVIIANGTDAPVESVDPIPNFYASVTRKRTDGGMAFFPEQKMTREEAIYTYTLGNAYAAFEEKIKGSLEPGKLADMVLLSQNLISITEDSILETKVLMTIVGGDIKYRVENF